MKTKALFLLPLLLLCSCSKGASNTASSSTPLPSAQDSTLSESVASSTSSVNPDGPYELKYAPKEAPQDYVGKTPLDYLDTASEEKSFDLYNLIDHRLMNSNFVSRMYGTAKAGSLYTQRISSMKVVNGTTGLNHLVAISNSALGGSIAVNSAEQRLENIQEEKYAYREGDGSSCSIDDDNDGVVQTWMEKSSEIFNRNSFLQSFGHDIFGWTSYYVSVPSDIRQCNMLSSVGGYQFQFSFAPNAGRFYQIEQEHMINIAGSELSIRSLEVTVTIDKEFRPLKMTVNETYQVSVASFVNLDVNSNFSTEFLYFEEGEDIPDEKAKGIFDDAVSALM